VTPLVATLHGERLHVADLTCHNGADIDVLGYQDSTPFHAARTESIGRRRDALLSGESNTEEESRRKGA
jgi:hypothetical protein